MARTIRDTIDEAVPFVHNPADSAPKFAGTWGKSKLTHRTWAYLNLTLTEFTPASFEDVIIKFCKDFGIHPREVVGRIKTFRLPESATRH